MQTGRRSFLKTLGGFLAGLTVAGKMKAAEAKKAQQYPETYRRNNIVTKKSQTLTAYSGIIHTGIW